MSAGLPRQLLRTVLDLNIIISAAVVLRGPAFAVWHSWRAGEFRACISEGMLIELAGKLAEPRFGRRHRIGDEDIRTIVGLLRTRSLLVHVPEDAVIPVTGDPEVDLVLATARLGQAEYLITRDRGLLGLGRYESVVIIDPSDFLRVLGRSSR